MAAEGGGHILRSGRLRPMSAVEFLKEFYMFLFRFPFACVDGITDCRFRMKIHSDGNFHFRASLPKCSKGKAKNHKPVLDSHFCLCDSVTFWSMYECTSTILIGRSCFLSVFHIWFGICPECPRRILSVRNAM